MDSGSSSPAPRRGKRRRLVVFIVFLVATLLAVALILVLFSPRQSKLVWLTPAEYMENVNPGPLPWARQMFRKWVRPVINKIAGTPPGLSINSSFYQVRPGERGLEVHGTPLGTNIDGIKLWICPEPERQNLDGLLHTLQSEDVRLKKTLARPWNFNFLVQSGMRAVLLPQSQSVPVKSTNVANPAGFTYVQVGVKIDFRPKLKGDSLEFLGQFESSEVDTNSVNAPAVRTNFTIAFQATIPKGNSLIIQCPDTNKVDPVDRWLLIVPARVDTKGNAKK